jgi:hypothetical protein
MNARWSSKTLKKQERDWRQQSRAQQQNNLQHVENHFQNLVSLVARIRAAKQHP